MVEDYPEAIAKLMEGMIVVRAESLFAYDSIEYVAISFRFLPVKTGAMVPTYHITYFMGRFAPVHATFSHESEKYSFKRGLVA